jgi:hypothetical protein
MLETMFGMKGVALPHPISRIALATSLEALGVTWGSTFSGVVPAKGAVMWISALLLVVWFFPNTQQIMRRYRPAIRTARQAYEWQGLRSLRAVLEWRPTPLWMLFTVILFVTGTGFILGQTSEFLYFQF